MAPDTTVSIPGFPSPFRWRSAPEAWSLDANNVLSITAGPRSDWFLDPNASTVTTNAPALLMPVQSPCILKAYVTVEYASTYDAGVLTVYQSDTHWGKICLELSPQGQLMIVSVVTKGRSDDSNSVLISGKSAYLRLAKLDTAFALHYSTDGHFWHMVRYFSLGDGPTEIGFLAQSPTGEKLTATFSQISFEQRKLANIRNGE